MGFGFVGSGNPLLFEAYWRENADLGTTVIPGWYRMGYRPQDSATTFYMDAFMDAIRDLHALVGNAVTEGRYIVAGTGSMQLINAVVHSLALQDEGRVSPVVAKAPFYSVSKHFPKGGDSVHARFPCGEELEF
jgi:hypothetical protein